MARPKITWTDAMLEELVCSFPIMSNKELATKMGISARSVIRKAKEMRLCKAFTRSDNYKVWDTVERMFGKFTYKEIACEAHVTERTVKRICKKLKLRLDRDEISRHHSEAQIKVQKSEKRRIIFGLEQRTDRRIGYDKARSKVLGLLAKHGYITVKGSRTAYYSEEMQRAEHIESYAASVGVDIEPWEAD